MAKTMKKMLSLVLVAIMVLSMIPAVYADEDVDVIKVTTGSDLLTPMTNGSEANSVSDATYYYQLQNDITMNTAKALYIGKYVEKETETEKGHAIHVVLDLNGFTLTDAYSTAAKNRMFALYSGSSIHVKNGKIVSNTSIKALGGVFFGVGGSDFTFDNVTIETYSPSTSAGGVLHANGAGAVVTLNNSTFTRLGGTCAGNGSIIAMAGGNLYLNNSHISGGKVVQTVLGKAAQGGNIFLDEGAQCVMNGGSITNGYVEGATASGTSPSTGGNVYLYGKNTKFTLNSGIISGGEAKTIGIKAEGATSYSYGYATGGNVGVQGKDGNNRAYFIMNGGQVINGKVTYDKNTSASTYRRGGNFGLYSNANVTINAGEVSDGSSYRGGAVDMWTTSCSLEINGGTVRDNGFYVTGQMIVKGGLLDQAAISVGSTYLSQLKIFGGTILHNSGYGSAIKCSQASKTSLTDGKYGWCCMAYVYGGKFNFAPTATYGDQTVSATGVVTNVMYRGVVDACSEIIAPSGSETLYTVKHKDNSTTVTTPATCTESGSVKTTCTNCDMNRYGVKFDGKYTYEIPATGHTAGEAVIENEVANSCTAEGSYDTVVYCTVCEAEISRETTTVAAAGHTPGEEVIENQVANSCTADGSYDTVVYCTVCSSEISRETT
ncbi:MAG: hypothetical protein IKU07_09880, partial [Oscillospiraceae bacterium]|nr:hypothetical protein [Oscillospiraceae bacterium]